jgi:SAM-dependent methyltransferase
MLAPRQLPPEYLEWNRRWGAPFGRRGLPWPLRATSLDISRRGPFAWQPNNSTRAFEYPWTYDSITRLGPSLQILEMGGGLSGLQFVLASEGHQVTNVDPGLNATGKGWALDYAAHKRLQKCYSAPVLSIANAIQDSNVPSDSADVIMSVSAIEHFSASDLASAASHVHRVLKPGGHVVFTTDLFLDVQPFTRRQSNLYGSNINIKDLLELMKLELIEGRRRELFGYDEFSTEAILGKLADYHVGAGYPCLAQCFVARKPR